MYDVGKENSRMVDIWDYHIMLSDISGFKTRELAYQNECYRIATVLKQFAGIKNEVRCNFVLEHGPYLLKNYAFVRDIIYNAPIVTFGECRKEILEEIWKKRAYTIGPYIAYAKDYYTKERVEQIKSKFGKTLLVFPSHTTDRDDFRFCSSQFCQEIERVKEEKKFDTVMVCIHHLDIPKGIDQAYSKAGYTVVSAGHGSDEAFFSRLKSIIKLSDAVMANDVGTSLAYAVYLKKPCYIYLQKRIADYPYKMSDEYYKILEKFSKDDFVLSNEQLELCNYVYGFDQVKTQEELRKFILEHSK